MKRQSGAIVLVIPALLGLGCTARTASDDEPIAVDGSVALGALMALGDGHLERIAEHLQMLARTADARSGDWERIRGPLGAAKDLNGRALLWFALPDGSYWSVQEGRAEGSLSDRPYWPRLMAGESVLGDLVVSRATRKSSAIVAVPVRDANGRIVGVLGSSSYLNELSERIHRELHLQPRHIFYSLDATPVVGLHIDPETIFLHPLEEGDPHLEKAIREIVSREEGTATYTFRGRQRTVLYRRSPVSGWWYAFGVAE
jgi:methyl-accepting chemotaxis protein